MTRHSPTGGTRRGASPRQAASATVANELEPARLRAALLALGVLVVYGVAESLLWRDALWGFHFYGFYPRWTLVAAPAALFFLTPAAARLVGAGASRAAAGEPTAPPRASRWLPWLAAASAGILFWLLRERHLFWGDSLPLSILIPEGQSFHPDEPLTLFVHQALYRLAGGRLSGADAVALGSVLAGAAFVGWTVHWFSRRGGVAGWKPAAAVLLAQGAMQIFFGHVENYSYLALCLLLFATLGVDFLERRGDPYRPLLAAVLAFAFHILGGLAIVPAGVLIAAGVRDPERRRATLRAAALAAAVLVAGALASASLYEGSSAWGRFVDGFRRVLTNPRDAQASRLLSLRRLADAWSVLWLTGPLSAPLLAVLLLALPGARFARSAPGLFLLAGTAAFLALALSTGPGNLGSARNWDLHAAPFVFPALAGVLLVTDHAGPTAARRLLAGLLAVSLFHSIPWIALNTSFERTVARVLVLPFEGGRGPMMLGTHYYNAGELPEAERWFRRAVERDSTNVNAQSGLGLSLARQGRLEEAVGPMTMAVRLKPVTAQLRTDLVTLLLRLERWGDAAPVLELGLAQEPGDRRAWLTLADCRLRLAQPDSAALTLEVGLRYFPDDPEMTSMLGIAYQQWVAGHGRRAEWDAARRALDRFAARFPGDPRVTVMRAMLPRH